LNAIHNLSAVSPNQKWFTGLVPVEDPQTEIKVDVRGGEASYFRWAATGLVQGGRKLPEVAIGNDADYLGSFLRSSDSGAAPARRLLDVSEWVGPEDALLVSPVKGPPKGDDGIPLPLPRVGAKPFGDMKRLQLTGWELAVE
jgi:hypothetical protein